MSRPGEQTFAQSELDNLTDAQIAELLKGCGVRIPPPKIPQPVSVYKANFKDDK